MQEKPFNTINQKISIEPLKNKYPKDQITPENIDPLQDEIKLQYTYFKNKHTPDIVESPSLLYHRLETPYQKRKILNELSASSELKLYIQNDDYAFQYKENNYLQDFPIIDLLRVGINLWKLPAIHLDKIQMMTALFSTYFKLYLDDHNKNEVDIENGVYTITLTESCIMDFVQDFLVSHNVASKEYFIIKNRDRALLSFKKNDYLNTKHSSLLLNFKQKNKTIKRFLSEQNLNQFIDKNFLFSTSEQRSKIIEIIEQNIYRFTLMRAVNVYGLLNCINSNLQEYNIYQFTRRKESPQKSKTEDVQLSPQKFDIEDVRLFIEKYFAHHVHKNIAIELAEYWWNKFQMNTVIDENRLYNLINKTLSKNFLYFNIFFADDMQEMRDGVLVGWNKNQFDNLLKQNDYDNKRITVNLLNRQVRKNLPKRSDTLQLPNKKYIYFIENASQSILDSLINYFESQSISKIINTQVSNLDELSVKQLTSKVSKTIPGIAEHRIKLFSESFIAMKRGTIKAQMQRELEESERTINSQDLAEFTRYVKDVLLYESHATLKDLFDHYLTEFRDYQNPPIAWTEFNSYWKEYRNLYKSKFDRVYAKNRTNVQVAMPVELVGDFLQFLYDMSVKKLKFSRGTKDLQTKEQMQQSFIQYIESWREKSRLSQETK